MGAVSGSTRLSGGECRISAGCAHDIATGQIVRGDTLKSGLKTLCSPAISCRRRSKSPKSVNVEETKMLAKIAPLPIAVVFGLSSPTYAQSGKNPPGVNPTHYQCYTVEAPNEAATVKLLRDQFGVSEGVKIGKLVFLCSPTAKNGVAPKDRVTHYLCYEDEGVKPANRKALVINQFTKATGIELAVEAPKMLCAPSRKKLL
jgi:hypothetical protein